MYNIYDIEKINYYLIYNDEKQVLQLKLLPWVGTSVMALMCEKARVTGKKPRVQIHRIQSMTWASRQNVWSCRFLSRTLD